MHALGALCTVEKYESTMTVAC